jgi:hypothetical protein
MPEPLLETKAYEGRESTIEFFGSTGSALRRRGVLVPAEILHGAGDTTSHPLSRVSAVPSWRLPTGFANTLVCFCRRAAVPPLTRSQPRPVNLPIHVLLLFNWE